MAELEGRIPVNIEEEMRKSYMDYAMSVIVGRALPDVRDGLKPVHRRILYAMLREGLVPGRKHSKCAGVVGEVLKKYHPHGDASVYDALVRMAQDFNMRYPLIDGKGNFGSMDGDPPAAYRYTEARLQRLAQELLVDIDKETVDFLPNFDGTTEEPTVLPSRVPNLLVNGAAGIAVGMATNIPPHNLGEVCDALLLLVNKPDATFAEILELIPGPDFPTAGIIHGDTGILDAYRTGRGIIKLRGRYEIEKKKGDREQIVFTEIPYQLNKAKCVEKIAELVRERRLEGISDLRDESDRDGIRIVIELKRGENPEVVANQLFALTPLQSTFGIILLAIHGGQPRVFDLLGLLHAFLDHRRDVVRRRALFELREAEARAHILEGLKIALDALDEVISLIRRSQTGDEARQALLDRFGLSDLQARAILDMRLQRLTGLEREKVESELAETVARIGELKAILADEERILAIVAEETRAVKEQYADPRLTQIVKDARDLSREDLIAPEDMVVTCSHGGYVKRTPAAAYRSQRRGGKGRIGMRTAEEDWVEHLFVAGTLEYVMVFTNLGKVRYLKVHEIPAVATTGKGQAVVNLLNLASEEKVAAFFSVPAFVDDRFIVLVTKNGIVKKTELSAFKTARAAGIIALTIDEGDELLDVKLTDGNKDLFLATAQGMAIRFHEKDVREMGRLARGVKGIELREGDRLVGMAVVESDEGFILTLTGKGYGKRTSASEYRPQGRGGLGLVNIKLVDRKGGVIGIRYVTAEEEVLLVSASGMILRTGVKDISEQGRGAQGVKIIDIAEGDEVVALAKIEEGVEGSPGSPEAEPPDAAGTTDQGEGGES
ncbi:MAG: DNA gyrase subunit A [Acidobacteriota bacterium]